MDWCRKLAPDSPRPGSGLDFWAFEKRPHICVIWGCSDCWISAINANSCNEFRMILNLDFMERDVLVIPNGHLIFVIPNIKIASYKKWHAGRIIVSSSRLNIIAINSEFLFISPEPNGVCMG